jgi:DNA-binding SARP family transcriptional activator/tetratricopeptide (TPR) repeat protein
MVEVIERQIAAIASSGQYSRAAGFLEIASPNAGGPIASVIRARLDLHGGRTARARSELGRALADESRLGPESLQVVMSIAIGLGDMDTAAQVGQSILAVPDLPDWNRVIAKAALGMREVALTGSLSEQIARLEEAATTHERGGRLQLAAISRYNLADTRYGAGQYERALRDARAAIEFLARSGGDANEIASAYGVVALCLLALDRFPEAENAMADAERARHSRLYDWEISIQRAECLVELGHLADGLAEARRAADGLGQDPPWNALAAVATTAAEIATKAYDFTTAERWLSTFDAAIPTTLTVGLGQQRLARARLRLMTSRPASEHAEEALAQLQSQDAWHFASRAAIVAAVASGDGERMAATIHESAMRTPSSLRAEAAVVCAFLGALDRIPDSLGDYVSSAPAAWTPHFRRNLRHSDPSTRWRNGALLERNGGSSDVAPLRAAARTRGMPAAARHLGKALARRTAPHVLVRDLGRTYVDIGDRSIEATTLRRKVAGFALYLMTRPGYTATREQVLEALWPDAPPDVGTNSLHQTIYFLRRDLEPGYAEDVSAGYVRLEGELVWFDPELVDSASRRFSSLAGAVHGAESAIDAISLYRGKFAPEFEYEDWAIATRDALHAAYLELVQRTIDELAAIGSWQRAAEIARVCLAVDPDADVIERTLIALYQGGGSHAAAAEQYAHFAAGHRATYGVEAPSLEEIATTPNPR